MRNPLAKTFPLPMPPLEGTFSEKATSAFQQREGHVDKVVLQNLSKEFSEARDGLKKMKEKEVKFGYAPGKGMEKDPVFWPLIFLLNLVLGATRTFLYWSLSTAGNMLGLKSENATKQMKEELLILIGLLNDFANGVLKVFPPTEWYYNAAFILAKEIFEGNCHLWGKVVGVDLDKNINSFYAQLQFLMFSANSGSLWGLSSINGEFIYVNLSIGTNLVLFVRVLLHEMAHSFFRFVRLQQELQSDADVAFMLSPVWNSNIQYKGFPIHSGTLYDYIFSDCLIDDSKCISPFSLLYDDYHML